MAKRSLAFSYVRISSNQQKKGSGIERQLAKAKDYAERNGLELSEENFADLGMSAYRGKNLEEGGELRSLINAIKDGVIPRGSTIIIEELSRFSRSFILQSLSLIHI